MKVTALVFSKDDTKQAVELAKSVHASFDEMIILDASGKRDKSYLMEQKRRLGLKKLKVFNVVALGFREPLMAYALTKCRNEWVLVLNTDERPSDGLVSDLPALISRKGCDAYSIPLYSIHVQGGRTFVSSQIRLFKKGKIEFMGMLHEQPLVHGKFLELIGSKYCINHMIGKVHSTKVGYAEMERFQRFTYSQFNDYMLEMSDRARRIYSLNKKSLSPVKRLIRATLRLYEALGLKAQDQEVSNFDYFASRLARDIAHVVRRRRLGGIVKAIQENADYAGKMKVWRSAETSDEDFEIAKIITKTGTVKFIGLDRVDFVEKLNKKYIVKPEEQGIGLLIRLLREKYRLLENEG